MNFDVTLTVVMNKIYSDPARGLTSVHLSGEEGETFMWTCSCYSDLFLPTLLSSLATEQENDHEPRSDLDLEVAEILAYRFHS